METEIKVPDFAFLQGKLTQSRGLKALSKRYNYNEKIMFLYEIIESFELTRQVTQDKIYSRKAESGYVEKTCIGSYITDYKAEVYYYRFLQNGGQKYSEYLEEKKRIEKKNQEISSEARLKEQKAKAFKDRQEEMRSIKMILELSQEQYIHAVTGKYTEELVSCKKEKQTKYNVSQIKWLEEFIPNRIASLKKSYYTIHRVYKLSGGDPQAKFIYKVGDEVLYIRDDKYVPTCIEELRTNPDESVTYKLKKAEGIVNTYVGYCNLYPANIIE